MLDNPDIDIVCELMGAGKALELTRRALDQGKIVVTANKALICEHGEELFEIEMAGTILRGFGCGWYSYHQNDS